MNQIWTLLNVVVFKSYSFLLPPRGLWGLIALRSSGMVASIFTHGAISPACAYMMFYFCCLFVSLFSFKGSLYSPDRPGILCNPDWSWTHTSPASASLLVYFCNARDSTRGLAHARQALRMLCRPALLAIENDLSYLAAHVLCHLNPALGASCRTSLPVIASVPSRPSIWETWQALSKTSLAPEHSTEYK